MTTSELFKFFIPLLITGVFFFSACSDDGASVDDDGGSDEIDFSDLTDTYYDNYYVSYYKQWGIHNVHDAVIRKSGDYWYAYSTDVGYGISVRLGLQIRRSKNLVNWETVGWVFDSLPEKGAAYIESKGATPNESLWAPSIVEYNGEYRLYYSLASDVGRVSCIGLATSTAPSSGFEEVDVVVATNTSGTQTNGIDPSVIITPEGEHWMVYGSSWDGIYLVQLEPSTGLALTDGDRGVRIAHRGFTSGTINGNIEGAEVIYNQELGYYYLFIAYDWLSTKYNIRVGRSQSIEGPYLDMFGNDMKLKTDNYPMIVAPYAFKGHSGWQGVSHCTVFDDNGQYYIAHQGRPSENAAFMDLHVRQLFWDADGWPVASPERYAGQELRDIDVSDIPGQWEIINFDYTVVPGFAETQTSPDLQKAKFKRLNSDGTIDSSSDNTWSYEDSWLTITLDGVTTKVHVSNGRDWENEEAEIIVFTGTKTDGLPLWGKRVTD